MSEIKKLPSENGSIISAKISEVEEEDKNSNSNKSKSSEFDINKTPSSSHDEPSNNEIEEEIKYVDKRKTSASTKEIKNNMAGVIQRRHRHSSHNRNISLMNESSQIIRNSAANSSLSFTSNKTFDNKIIDVSISKNEIKESKVSK